MSTWSDMNAAQRNHWLGELIGATPQSQCFLAVDGKRVLATPYAEKDRMKVDAALAVLKGSDASWAEFRAANSQSEEAWREKLQVHIERWHLRYSDTPGGAWELVDWLKRTLRDGAVEIQVGPSVTYVRVAEAYPGSRKRNGNELGVAAGSATFEAALCDCILQLKAPEMRAAADPE